MDFLQAALRKKRAEVKQVKSLVGDKFASRAEVRNLDVASLHRKRGTRSPTSQLSQAPQGREKKRRMTNNENSDSPSAPAGDTGTRTPLPTTTTTTTTATATSTTSATTSQPSVSESTSATTVMSVADVMIRLRINRQPITLFGETNIQRYNRLKAFEVDKQAKIEGSGGALLNEMAEMQQAVERELKHASSALEDAREQKAREDARMERRTAKYRTLPAKSKFADPLDYIAFFFKRVLHLWALRLHGRPDRLKASTAGKGESAQLKQTKLFIKPFFSMCQNRSLSADIAGSVETIVDRLISGDWDAALEAYVTLSIGNQAWPMGVTMVGIHARAGRERLHSDKVAHVLNDERQRKYIHALKRLMTEFQKIGQSSHTS